LVAQGSLLLAESFSVLSQQEIVLSKVFAVVGRMGFEIVLTER